MKISSAPLSVSLAAAGLVAAALCIATTQPCPAYAGPGHSFVGGLADERLAQTAPSVQKWIRDELDGLSLEHAATIPDEIRNWDMLPGNLKQISNISEVHSAGADIVGLGHARGSQAWSPKLRQAMWEYFRKNSKRVEGNQPAHHVYHFTDISVAGSLPLKYDYHGHVVGESDTDIVHTLVACYQVLQTGHSDEARGITRPVAIVLLSHFIGDLHQPLHVGAAYFAKPMSPEGPAAVVDPNGLSREKYVQDLGGNAILIPTTPAAEGDRHPQRILLGAHSDNLHSFWDKDTVEVFFKGAKVPSPLGGSSFVRTLAAKAAPAGVLPNGVIKPEAFFSACAEEILPTAREAHSRLRYIWDTQTSKSGQPHHVIEITTSPGNSNYLDWAAGIVEERLVAAGYRLAWVLEQGVREQQ